METRLSSKGQVVLPSRVRRKLGLAAGDALRVDIDCGRVLLTPRREHRPRSRVSRNARTGLPVLKPAAGAPVITSETVARLLEELP
jgi:AbrB family looped-hinge helix DNA binding protein